MSRTPDTADVVICGAGIAGVATAYHLSVERGITDVAIVDPLAPLSLTSDKSMECYRNWYPGPGDAMVRLMNRSIDLIERLERDNAYRFNMNRRGYLFATADPAQANRLLEEAREEERLGTGELRVHRSAASESVYTPAPGRGFEGEPSGSDLLLDPDLIQTHFPYLSQHTIGLLHTRRCGWFSAHEYASFLLEQARAHGVQLVNARVESVTCAGGQVNGVRVSDGGSARTIGTRCFVSAAGPMQTEIGAMLDVDLPIACELHVKAAFHDPGQVIPRDAPQIIWMDPVHLRWTEEERGLLSEAPETVRMLDEFPPGVHGRPEGGGDVVLLQWSNDNTAVEPSTPTIPRCCCAAWQWQSRDSNLISDAPRNLSWTAVTTRRRRRIDRSPAPWRWTVPTSSAPCPASACSPHRRSASWCHCTWQTKPCPSTPTHFD